MARINSSDILNSRLHDLWSKYKWVTWSPIKAVVSILDSNTLIATIEEIFGSDLNISSISNVKRLKPLAGFNPLKADRGRSIFPEGFHVSFTICHNGIGNETILLREMSLIVEEFTPGLKPEFSYIREGEQVIGAGIVQPWCFSVVVKGHQVFAPYWTMPMDEEPVQGTVENFFKTENPKLMSFSKDDHFIQEIQGTVHTTETGLYKIRLGFWYNIGGNKDVAYYSNQVLVYNQETDE